MSAFFEVPFKPLPRCGEMPQFFRYEKRGTLSRSRHDLDRIASSAVVLDPELAQEFIGRFGAATMEDKQGL